MGDVSSQKLKVWVEEVKVEPRSPAAAVVEV